MNLTRRRFLQAGAASAAALAVPWSWLRLSAEAATVADLTTLGRTIVKGARKGIGTSGNYYALAAGQGEPHLLRTELAAPRPAGIRRSLLHFAHFTDIHLVDAQSPARVEWLDRFNDPGAGCQDLIFNAAFRAHETLTLQVFEAMVRQVRAIQVSPVTGAPLVFSICTGDNIDNEQYNELRWFIDLMDGGHRVQANSGGPAYEGVQSAAWADPEYWHPDPGIADKYKQTWGFPEYPGLLTQALVPFTATGIGMPWYQTYGNHDGLVQGNFPRDSYWSGVSTGSVKVTGAPPGINPCDSFTTLRTNPTALASAPARAVTADANRRVLSRAEYGAELFKSTGSPAGHGLSQADVTAGRCYWYEDHGPLFRLIALDTVNPGGESDGSVGAQQLAWLEQRLVEVSSSYVDQSGTHVSTTTANRLVIIFSHHGLRSLSNPFANPDPLDPTGGDQPRQLASAVQAVVDRYPNVIAWVNGHTHQNIIQPRPNSTGGWWDIGTAAHIDWSSQTRLVEVVDNGNSTLSIFCTMVDHAAPITPGGSDDVLRLASIARELTANDYQYGFGSKGPGTPTDRNVELLIRAPFALTASTAASPQTSSAGGLPPTSAVASALGPAALTGALVGGAALAALRAGREPEG